ncbi:hypothetical protein AMATHDRAFT_159435, partial [Amanita thiersii Skay4041]
YVSVSLLHTKQTTPIIKRSLNPVFPAKEATFEFPIYLSVVERLLGGVGVVELVVWDKDMFSRDYLGEVGVGVERWFKRSEEAFGWDEPGNKPFVLSLESTRANTAATGTIKIKMGFVHPPGGTSLLDFNEIYRMLVRRSRGVGLSVVSAPPVSFY